MSNQYWLHQPTSQAQQPAHQQSSASYWSQINLGSAGQAPLSQPQTNRSEQTSSFWTQESVNPVPTVQAQHQHIAQAQHQHTAQAQHQLFVQPQNQHHQPILPQQIKQHQPVLSAAPLTTDGSSSTISSRGKVTNAAVAHVAPLASAPVQEEQSQLEESTLAPPQEEVGPVTPERMSPPPQHIATSTPINSNPAELQIPASDESGQTNSSTRQEEERDSHSSMVIVDRNDVADADTANHETVRAQQHQQLLQNQQFAMVSSVVESQDDDRSIAGSTRGATKGTKTASSNIRERYKTVFREYPNIMERMDRYRKETPSHLDWRTAPKNPLTSMAAQNPAFTRNLIGSSQRLNDGSVSGSVIRNSDARNVNIQPPPSELDEDDITEMLRKTRKERAAERAGERERPSSRARSEYGEVQPQPARAPRRVNTVYNGGGAPAYPNNFYAVGGYGHHYVAPSGRFTPNGQYSYDAYQANQMPRRPMSSFEPSRRYAASVQGGGRQNNTYNDYDRRSLRNASALNPAAAAGGYEADSYSDNESRLDESDMGSEEELEMYHQNQSRMSQPSYFMDPYAMQVAQEEQYYFGVVKLNLQDVQAKLHSNPPPDGYYQLKPLVRAAFMFYFELYNKHYHDASEFDMVFNREFYKYKCEGLTDVEALVKICEHTQIEYNEVRERCKQRNRRAYEASQRQLFSDDRETPDASDRGSVYDQVDDSVDLASIDSVVKEPLKYRERHAIANFGPGGRMVVLDPMSNMYAVKLTNFRDFVNCPQIRKIAENMETFKGPLVWNETPTHTVRLFIDRQIARIRSSDLMMANPTSSDANDCLLIWELLQMIVQQQGRVTGPDLAQLLVRNSAVFNHQRAVRGSSVSDIAGSTSSLSLADSDGRRVDANAYERFTNFLLGGHIDEAIENAIRDGMYADAFVLARRLYPNDPTKLDQIEAKLLAQRPVQSPVLTLLSVASGEPALVLTNPTDDPALWRAHAAIVLANLTTGTTPHAYSHAMNTVYHLGRALARRDFHSAADFCFLAVNLLADMDPFRPVEQGNEEDQSVRQHIDLIHASIPDDYHSSHTTPFGWSLIDLQATEIYAYVMRLKNNGQLSALNVSVAFQTCRMQYAQMLAEMGGMTTDAYRYYFDIVMTIWNVWHMYPAQKILEMCELADRLKYVACATEAQTAWFSSMKDTVMNQLNTACQHPEAQPQAQQPPQDEDQSQAPQIPTVFQSESEISKPTESTVEQVQQQPEQLQAPWESVAVNHPQPPQPAAVSWSDPEAHHESVEPVHNEQREQAHWSSPNFRSSQVVEDPPTSTQKSSTISSPPTTEISDTLTHSEHEDTPYSDRTDPEVMSPTPISPVVAPVVQSLPAFEAPSLPPLHSVQPEPAYHQEPRHESFSVPPTVSPAAMPPMAPSVTPKVQMPAPSLKQAPSRPADTASTSQPQKPSSDNEKKSGGGWLAGLISKAIPSRNEMILPDDKSPAIVWDEQRQCWVGDGVERLEDVPPPPATMSAIPPAPAVAAGAPPVNTSSSGGGLQRRSRYVNAGAFQTAPSSGANALPVGNAMPAMPMVPGPATFHFMPSPPENDNEEEGAVNPFAPSTNTEGSS
ncbi:hypothetical protein QR680_019213 [Steinernema hermaphroditum]|uniref:Protein transport protein sec16 n=1 Tax=Steinernema hermaphroditum TaxID=289476 RepID=A0AA39HLC3_9BILA|nr:hypothetical protein QR680_019213 [Steinernema hermaphroditum]